METVESKTRESNLYRQLLEAENISLPMQKRILDYGRRRKKWSLLIQLANYPQLAPEIDQQIGEHNELEILVAWAKKPGRTEQELTTRLAADKRVSVALSLANLPDLNRELYAALATIDSTNLTTALAKNVSVPFDIRLSLMSKVAQTPPRSTYDPDGFLKEICVGVTDDETDQFYQKILETTTATPYIRVCFDRGIVTAKHIDQYVSNFTEIYNYGKGKWHHDARTILAKITRSTISRDQRNTLIDTLEKMYDQNSKEYLNNQIPPAIALLKNYDETIEQDLQTLIATTDTASADQLVGSLLARKCSDTQERALHIAAEHEHVSAKIVIPFLETMGMLDQRAFIQKLEQRGDLEILADIAVGGKHIHWLENSLPVIMVIVKRCIAAETTIPDWTMREGVLANNLEIGLHHTSWELLSGRANQVEGLATLIEKTILENLEDNASYWETFSNLSEEYTGSLFELLQVARKL